MPYIILNIKFNGGDRMAKLISVPDRLYDELKILKEELAEKKNRRVSFSEAMEIRYKSLQRRYNKLKQGDC